MKRQYCTLFDSTYADKGFVMLESLRAKSRLPVYVHILALDDAVFKAGRKRWPDYHWISLGIFELLARVNRGDHTWQEYCWLLASQLMEYNLLYLTPDDKLVTYLDADLYFFSDPRPIFDQIGSSALGIVPHRFAPEHRERLIGNGNYNVGWVSARNNMVGLRAIRKWAADCRAWCYYRQEDGKFADQKYLDAWPELYGWDVRVIDHPGVGLAPWNLTSSRISGGPRVNGRPVIFYHFHEFSLERMSAYPLRDEDRKWIYEPYQAKIDAQRRVYAIEGVEDAWI